MGATGQLQHECCARAAFMAEGTCWHSAASGLLQSTLIDAVCKCVFVQSRLFVFASVQISTPSARQAKPYAADSKASLVAGPLQFFGQWLGACAGVVSELQLSCHSLIQGRGASRRFEGRGSSV